MEDGGRPEWEDKLIVGDKVEAKGFKRKCECERESREQEQGVEGRVFGWWPAAFGRRPTSAVLTSREKEPRKRRGG